MKRTLFGALMSALLLAVAVPAGAATVSGTSNVNAEGSVAPGDPTVNFSPGSLVNGTNGINGATFTTTGLGKKYFDYVFSFDLTTAADVAISADAAAGTHIEWFQAALFSSSPAGTALNVGHSPNPLITLTDTTGLITQAGGKNITTDSLSASNLGAGLYYLRLFGVITGNSGNSHLTSLAGSFTATPVAAATPIPGSLLLLVTGLGILGLMAWPRRVPARLAV